MGLEIVRELLVVPDREQPATRVTCCVEHDDLAGDVLAERRPGGESLLQAGDPRGALRGLRPPSRAGIPRATRIYVRGS